MIVLLPLVFSNPFFDVKLCLDACCLLPLTAHQRKPTIQSKIVQRTINRTVKGFLPICAFHVFEKILRIDVDVWQF